MFTNGNKPGIVDMQRFFEDEICSVRIVSDLGLSMNDYKSLGTKLKSLSFFTGGKNSIQDIMLSVVVYCTYSLVYRDESTDFDEVFKTIMSDSQYLERLYLKIYEETFMSYGLNRFGYDDSDIKARCIKLTARHAGIPDDEKDMFFDLISNYLECNDVSRMEESIFAALPYKSKLIFSKLDNISRQQIIIEARMLMYKIIFESYTRSMLLKEFPEMSISLIDHALCFVENHQMKVKANM